MKNVLKKFQEMEKGIKYVLIIYFVLVLADIVSTLFSWELLEYLEANPLYGFGGMPLIFILNILVMFIVYKLYSKTNNISLRFYLLLIMISVITTRCIVIYQNILIALNPPTVQQLQAIGTQKLAEIKKDYVYKIAMINILPFFNGVFTWLFFKKDHEVKNGDR